jgi:ABC-type glycerol-3-phosphate transport system substrate-binding protein
MKLYQYRRAKSMAGSNTLYMLFDNSTQFYDETWVVFYDKQLVSNTGLTDPSVLAASGKWTWEAFLNYSEAVAQKVMSKGSPDTATDIFGYASITARPNCRLPSGKAAALNCSATLTEVR